MSSLVELDSPKALADLKLLMIPLESFMNSILDLILGEPVARVVQVDGYIKL
jgi:hypothetical protein